MKKKSTPTNIGSTGTESDKPTPRPSILIDRGVKKAMRNSTVSNEKQYNKSTPRSSGRANMR